MAKNKIRTQNQLAAKAMQANRLAAQQKKEAEMAALELAASPDLTPGDVARVGNPVQIIEEIEVPNKAPKDQMSDDEVNEYVSRAIESATSWNSEQAIFRTRAQQYMDALPVGELAGSGIPGRSEFVSSDVADTINAAMPALIESFLASHRVVEFNAKKPEDEDAADMVTDLVNHIVLEQNPGFRVFTEWFLDALQCRFGVVLVRWDESEGREREEYLGQSDVQMGIIMDDPEVEIVSLRQYPDPDALRAALHAQFAQQQAFDAFQHAQEQQTNSLDDVHAAIAAMTQGQGASA
jgi:hypothetical protein